MKPVQTRGADALILRPHHGLCIPHFIGKGYSETFTKHMKELITSLQKHPEQKITLRASTDVLCAYCPHNACGVCTSGQKVARLDASVLRLCGLQHDVTLTWKKFAYLVRTRILAPGAFQIVCHDCQWKALCLEVQAMQKNEMTREIERDIRVKTGEN